MSSIIYLSDCTPLYTTLGAPERIPLVKGVPLYQSVRLEWQVPPNSDKLLIDSYIIRYKRTGAPITQLLNEVLVFFPTAVISGLSNGISYDFWVVAKNRFGESPHSDTISIIPGAIPSAIQLVRRAFHSTPSGDGIDGNNPQKVGVEFIPPIIQNGSAALTFTIKYTRINNNGGNEPTDVSYTQVYSVQPNETILDASGIQAINTAGVKGNYIRKELTPPTDATNPAFQTGNYRFQVFSSNIYGLSPAPDLSFVIHLYSNADANIAGAMIPRFTAPTLSSYPIPANGGIVATDANDKLIRFRWKQYRGSGTGSTGADAYNGWSYRIQYTDDPNIWYYHPTSISSPLTSSQFPEYTRTYDRTSVGSNTSDFEYVIDISRNVTNGRRYYVRYCVVSASGDTSEYTQVTSSNLSIVSCVPAKLPSPPPIFRASSSDRKVRLYFDWATRPPSLDVTGGLPIIDYRIVRYVRTRQNDVPTIVPDTYTLFDNIIGPYYEDTYQIFTNGIEYEYHVYSRNAFGLSENFTSITAIPSRPTDVVRNVTSYLDAGEITLIWDTPETLDQEDPIVQYYIEYKIFNLFNTSLIPSGNITGIFSGQTISNTVEDMNKILVNDTLWDTVNTPVVGIFTNSIEQRYTIRDLINNTAFIFRIAAVTQNVARRRIIGLRKVIGSNTPYLIHPVIVGRRPSKLTNVEYINADSSVIIKWTSTDIHNTEGILRFIVDYNIAGSNTGYSQRQIFYYSTSIFPYDGGSTVSFQIIVTGLNNNVAQRPDTRTNSYVMQFYAENLVSFTNEQNKVNLHTDLAYIDVFEGFLVPRVVRPRTFPSIIDEIRT